MGTAGNYTLGRKSINQDPESIKKLIDDAYLNHTWLRFMVHTYDFGEGKTFTGEKDLRAILSYCREKKIPVVTYATMFDTFGTRN
ncbi:MAG: hypothetical protein IJ930_04875 [Lachnospiraceae bacterium]|nr:hypothetical protein [Lachnospiraceae bacterium]